MRCCLGTLDEHMAQRDTEPEQGETLDCKYEEPGNARMIYDLGVWRWNKT